MKESILAFKLSMPNNNSWNGKWSGQDRCNIVFRKLGRSKVSHEKADKLNGKSFYYNFGDGWGASVKVFKVESKEAKKLKKQSDGFCGYDWMVNSIMHFGDIRTEEIPVKKAEYKLKAAKSNCCDKNKNGEYCYCLPF